MDPKWQILSKGDKFAPLTMSFVSLAWAWSFKSETFTQCDFVSHLQSCSVGQSSSLSVQMWRHDVATLTQPLQLLPLILWFAVMAQFSSWQWAFGVWPWRTASRLLVIFSCRVKTLPPRCCGQRKRSLTFNHLWSDKGKLAWNGLWFCILSNSLREL